MSLVRQIVLNGLRVEGTFFLWSLCRSPPFASTGYFSLDYARFGVFSQDHVATHTGEKAYKCSFCPEAFIWRPNMYAHQKKAHPVEYEALRREKEAANQP